MDTAVFVPAPPAGRPRRHHRLRASTVRGRPVPVAPLRRGRGLGRAPAVAPRPVVARTTVYPSPAADGDGGGGPPPPTLRQLLTPRPPPWTRDEARHPPPATTVTVYTAGGEAVDLAAAVEAFAPTTPVVLLWHRHTACTSCVAAAKELADAAASMAALRRSGAALVAVGCGTAADTAAFSAAAAWPGVALTDPSRLSYAALTSERAAAAARAGPATCLTAAAPQSTKAV